MEKIIDKIRKLLALADSPNEHEAALAAKKAQELLAEHNLSLSELEGKEEEGTEDGIFETASQPWQRPICGGVAKLYFCYYYFSFAKYPTPTRRCGYIRKDRHHFIGAAHNVAVAQMMAEYLLDTVERLGKEGSKTVSNAERSCYITTFRATCSARLRSRLYELWQAGQKPQVTTTGTTLPALTSLYEQAQVAGKQYLAEQGVRIHDVKNRMTLSHAQGMSDGKAAGDSISLNTQVGSGKVRGRLLGSS